MRYALPAPIVAQQSVVADFGEAPRQDVEQKAADKFATTQRQGLEPASLGVILVGKSQGASLQVEGAQAGVADGDAMRVTAQVSDHLHGTAECRLGIHDPLLFV